MDNDTALTPDSAQKALDDARSAMAAARKAFAHQGVGPILVVWGIVWLICFAVTQFRPEQTWHWGIGNGTGVLLTILIGTGVLFKPAVQSREMESMGRRIGVFWLACFAFIGLSIRLLWPVEDKTIGAFISLAIMFAYVVMGLWLESNFFVGLGALVAGFVVIGFFALPEWFSL